MTRPLAAALLAALVAATATAQDDATPLLVPPASPAPAPAPAADRRRPRRADGRQPGGDHRRGRRADRRRPGRPRRADRSGSSGSSCRATRASGASRSSVEEGVVTLTGHVEDAEVRDRLRDFVRRVEGVTLVLNQTRTDAQVLSAGQLLAKRLGAFWDLVLADLAGVPGGAGRADRLDPAGPGLLAATSDRLLAPLFESVLLRSVVGVGRRPGRSCWSGCMRRWR